ncbi:MAG: Topoisomerase binding zinc finger [Firmicutes bacterium]|nr:Topoisomerase binding zinc finger [Bacillota bacterium]
MNWQTYVLLGFLAGLVLGFPLLARRMREYRLSQAGLDDLTLMLDEDMLMHMARLLGALGYRVYRPTWEDAGFELVLVDGLGQKRGVLIAHWRTAVDVPVVQQAVAAAARLGGTAPMIVTVEYYTWKAREEAAEAGVILWTLRELTQAIGRVREAAVDYPEIPAIRTAAMGREPASPAVAEAGEAGDAARDALATILEPMPVRARAPAGAAPWPAPLAAEEAWPEPLPDEEPLPGLARPKRPWWQGLWKTAAKTAAVPPPQAEAPRCPRCGMTMVVRSSSQGDYWGCPDFPRCRGSRPKF